MCAPAPRDPDARRRERRRRRRPRWQGPAWTRVAALLFCLSFWLLAGIGCWRALR